MKLTALFLTLFFLQTKADVFSQTVTFSGKNVSVESVFTAIKNQTGYILFYAVDIWKGTKPVTLDVKNAPVEEVVKLVLKDQPISYIIEGKTIALSKKNETPEPKGTTKNMNETAKDIRGKVVGENGAGLQGVNVVVKGTSNGTSTNEDGEFLIQSVNESSVIIITSIGFDRQELSIKGKSFITINLKVSVTNLDEMQVIAYGKSSKRFSTGNISVIKAVDIQKQPVNNPLLALQGRVSGVNITQSTGLPGSGIRIEIRGRNSLTQGIDPLIIIDGVPYPSENVFLVNGNFFLGYGNRTPGNPLSNINPSDIEAISILKDADATAIYGSRGANGVILITTKKANSEKIKVDANVQTGTGKVQKELKVLNTNLYLEMRNEAFRNDGTLPNPSVDYDLTLWDTTRNTDWQKELIGRKAKYFDAQASFSNGTSRTQYRFSSGYHYETTVFPGKFYDRKGFASLNVNNASKNNKFGFQFSEIFSLDNNYLNAGDLTQLAIQLPPNAPPLYNADGSINWAPNSLGVTTWPGGFNPIATLNNKYDIVTQSLVSNAILSYKVINGLDVKTSLGYSNTTIESIQKSPLTIYDPSTVTTKQRNSIFSNSKISNWIIEPQITYRKKILKGDFTALVGSTIQQSMTNGESILASGFNSDLVMEDVKSAASILVTSTANSHYKYIALFGRLNYSLLDRYLINFTGRRDGSSRFGPENKFHNFGALGLGWIFSKEEILKNSLPFLSYGKLRASYGTTGSDQIGDYSFLDIYSTVNVGVPYQGGTSIYPTRIFTPDLSWEETRKLEIGLELGFLMDRIVIGASLYRNRSSNQLSGYSLPTISGFTSVSKNLSALIQNKGLELELRTKNVSSANFSWVSSFNFSSNQNKLISGAPGLNSFYLQKVGFPITSTFYYHFAGVNPFTGFYQFTDKKGNTTNSPNSVDDAIVPINITPKFYGGFQNSFIYKYFELDFLIQFVRQPQVPLYLYNYIPGYFSTISGGNQPVTVLSRWREPGDVASIQRYSQNSSTFFYSSNAQNSDQQFGDGSYARLKNISISSELPENWKKRIHLQGARIYVHGQNLFTITNYKGLDPETLSSTTLPPLRVITVGLQINL